MAEMEERNIIINLSRSQSDSNMVRWSNADDVGLRNRKMGVGIPRGSPYNKKYKRRRKDYDYYERRND